MFAGAAVAPEDQLDRSDRRRVVRRAVRDAGAHRRPFFVACGFVIASVLCTLAGPLLVRHGIDAGIQRRNSGALNLAVVGYVVVVIANYFISRQQFLAINRAGEGFLRDLRVRTFDHMMRQSMAFFDREKAGVLVARMTNDIETMSEIIQWGLLQFIAASLLVALALVTLLSLSWLLTLVVLLVFPIVIVASIRFQRDSNAAYLEVRERVAANLSALQEGITGVRVIQATARETEQARRFRRSNTALFDAHMRGVRVSTWYFGLVELAGVAATAIAVGVGGWMVHTDRVTLGTVTAFVLLLSNLFDPVQMLSQMYNTMQSAAASLNKIYGLLDTAPDVVEPTSPQPLPRTGDLVVTGLGFQYAAGTRPALSDVSLTIEAGERLALVGPTGAGKSTLAKLIARLYEPTHGSVSFGGVDVRQASTAAIRERIAVIPQEGFMFSGSVADNIRIARPDATDAEVADAVAAIGASERFATFEHGLQTEVRERGTRLSAGERQLVSLARAALVDPAVLVLDEATSNLDPGTEAAVEAALEHLMGERTVIVVAHRLSTVQRADRVAVIADGRLVELGRPDELAALPAGHYADLASSWARSSGAPLAEAAFETAD